MTRPALSERNGAKPAEHASHVFAAEGAPAGPAAGYLRGALPGARPARHIIADHPGAPACRPSGAPQTSSKQTVFMKGACASRHASNKMCSVPTEECSAARAAATAGGIRAIY